MTTAILSPATNFPFNLLGTLGTGSNPSLPPKAPPPPKKCRPLFLIIASAIAFVIATTLLLTGLLAPGLANTVTQIALFSSAGAIGAIGLATFITYVFLSCRNCCKTLKLAKTIMFPPPPPKTTPETSGQQLLPFPPAQTPQSMNQVMSLLPRIMDNIDPDMKTLMTQDLPTVISAPHLSDTQRNSITSALMDLGVTLLTGPTPQVRAQKLNHLRNLISEIKNASTIHPLSID